MRIHILDDWFDTLRGLPSYARLDGHDVTIWTDHEADPGRLAARLADADAICIFRERTQVGADLLDRLPDLRLISQRGVYPHVDVAACTERGVLLCSNRQKAGVSTAAAELTFALILAAARRLPEQFASLKAGMWQAGVGQSLHGRRLGLYGYGRIAKQVAGYAEAFGMEVVWWGSEDGRARATADGRRVAESRAAFFGESDFVSLHVRLKPETRGLIGAADLMAMKPSATFVNTSRAGLLAVGALRAALDAGRPGRVALDVFDAEPMTDPADPIVSHPAVIATPHIGFVTEDELDVQFDDIYEQVVAFAAGKPVHVVNPAALGA